MLLASKSERKGELMDEQQLRVYALERAIQLEGAKAVTTEVLVAAEEIYAFLKGVFATKH
jgi:hypothetical protein